MDQQHDILMAVRLWLATMLCAVGTLASFRRINLPALALVIGLALIPWRALFGKTATR